MDIMPDGSVVLTLPELQTSVIAVDLSPANIAGSSLANRLRNSEQAALDRITSERNNLVRAASFRAAIANKPIGEVATAALNFRDESGIDNIRTIVPPEEVELFEDAILILAESDPLRVAKHLKKRLGIKNASVYANMHITKAALLFDQLFPND